MISVVIPTYRSVQTLPVLFERLTKVLSEISTSYEIIFVDDCSNDGTWALLEKLARETNCVRAYLLSRNFGQHNALLCGLREARGSVVVTMDDDLQHPPEELPKLLDALTEDFDVVYGTPKLQQHGLFRNLASTITKISLQGSIGVENARSVSAYRIFRSKLRDAFSEYRNSTVSIDVLLAWATNKFTAVDVVHEPRRIGKSGYTMRKLLRHTVNMFTGFSTLPLRIASLIGFCFSLFGAGVLGYVIVSWFIYGSAVQGFVFLASVIAIFSGAQLLATGIIGEYLARMYTRMLGQPAYVVRKKISSS